jgi:hypothetical protein
VARFKEGFGAMPMCQDVLRFERLPLTAADRRLHELAARMAAGRRSGGAAPVEPSVAAAGGPT